MLLQLSIRNIALIEKLDVQFAAGLNVLTGETGAGKSIIVGSLDFVLGGRADKDRIAGGADRGRVEALFDVARLPRVQALLAEMALEIEDDLLPISREVNKTGRSVCRVAGVMVPLTQMRRVTDLLVDLHGQHAHQSLLDTATHVHFLDAMGGEAHRALVGSQREAYEKWSTVRRALVAAQRTAQERARRIDMLRFQLEELDGAELVEGEEETLQQTRKAMRNAEAIRDGLESAYAHVSGSFDDEMPAAMDLLSRALGALTEISQYSPDYARVVEELTDAIYTLEGVASDLSDMRDGAESDPDALEEAEERLDLLSRLKRKYGATTGEMIAFREQVRQELDDDENAEERIAAMQKDEKANRRVLIEGARALTTARHALAKECEQRVLAQLSDLGMQAARFEVTFAENAPMTIEGMDKVEFLLSANAGEPLRPLSRVASGGELSRIMLAFKVIEAESEGIPVLVFDEIDTGISGQMGQVVAEKMKQVAASRQVLCVTHLPQIAAIADTQYLVAKHEAEGRTRTTVQQLDGEGRVQVLSRMLGGGDTAVVHARAMLERRGSGQT